MAGLTRARMAPVAMSAAPSRTMRMINTGMDEPLAAEADSLGIRRFGLGCFRSDMDVPSIAAKCANKVRKNTRCVESWFVAKTKL
jgi:hypothetical protein